MAEPNSTTAEIQATSPGAVWRRVDLHLHSPGVPEFKGLANADLRSPKGRARLVEAYVTQLDTAKIEIGAITDYNAIHAGWFDPLRESAEAAGIQLLPGIELAFNVGKYGLHVLAVFDQGTEAAAVNAFLQSLDHDPSRPLAQEGQEHRHIDCQTNLADALSRLRERFGCLLLPAHPNQKNGLIKTFSAADAARYLLDVRFDALEHCPESELRRVRDTAVLPRGFWSDSRWSSSPTPKRSIRSARNGPGGSQGRPTSNSARATSALCVWRCTIPRRGCAWETDLLSRPTLASQGWPSRGQGSSAQAAR
ncbi:MAG: PHP domain-containing protein [Egibacteraceae bacterium]